MQGPNHVTGHGVLAARMSFAQDSRNTQLERHRQLFDQSADRLNICTEHRLAKSTLYLHGTITLTRQVLRLSDLPIDHFHKGV